MPVLLENYFESVARSLEKTLNTPTAYLSKIALTAVVIIFSLLLYILIKKIINLSVKNTHKRYVTIRVFKNVIISVMIFLILYIWIRAINALVLVALILGALLVLILRGITDNIIAFFIINYRNYIEVGNRVEIGDIVGDVIDITPVSFKVLEVRGWLSSNSNTGRIINIPNSIIFEKPTKLIGLESVYEWQEIKYTLSFDSKWEEAETIMTTAGNTYFLENILPFLEEDYKYLGDDKDALYPIFSLSNDDSGIIVNLRYLVDYREGTATRTILQRNILNGLKENPNIEFAVSDVRIV